MSGSNSQLDGGGLERVVIDLTREMHAANQKASILCIEKPGVLASKVAAIGASLYCAEKGPGLRWSVTDKIRSILREVRPDVVHTHQISALLYFVPISRELAPIVVHTEHNNQFRRYQTFRERLRYLVKLTIAGRRAERICCVSEDATESIRRTRFISRRKLFTVANGIDLSRFRAGARDNSLRHALGIPAGSFVLGNVARLVEMKRPDLLLKAFARINSEFLNTHLLLVGDGPLMPGLLRQAAELKVSDRVHFLGFQDNPETYLRLLDVFVLTSRMEGMPLSVLEAQASGIPVIASKVGGLEEISNKGEAIFLYDFGDMDAVHLGLRRLISDGPFRRNLGEAGRQHVLATYSSKRMAFDYEHHYTELLLKSGVRRRLTKQVTVDMTAQGD
jgi:glycosyltransferase involved in cell wall biosynthesis